LQKPYYLNRLDHVRKIRNKKKKIDIGTYSFASRAIKNWNQVPAEAIGFSLLNLRYLETDFLKAIIKWLI
jgi:hypothetical protein